MKHSRYEGIHRSLLAGLLSNVGVRGEGYEYVGPRGVKFSLHPGSALFGGGRAGAGGRAPAAGAVKRPRWVMAGELVETTKLYARTAAGIEAGWIEEAAGHLVERTHAEPRWDADGGQAIITETVKLYGLTLVAARNVALAPLNGKLARDLFIQHALVLNELRNTINAAFLRHNAALVKEVEGLEAKIRQKNLLADATTRFAFFDARLPESVTDWHAFERWRRGAEKENPRVLFLSKEDLLRADAPEITPANYPDRIATPANTLQLPLRYVYEPGEANDGVTLTVPLAALSQLHRERYEWLVPGMLEEKIGAMLRGLPGAVRRNFVPIPEWSRRAAEALGAPEVRSQKSEESSLREALAGYLTRHGAVEVKAEDFAEEELAAHLRMAFRVVDDAGAVVGFSRDLGGLQRKLAGKAADTFNALHDKRWHRDGVSVFPDLPETVRVERLGMSIVAHPALVDGGECVNLRLLPSAEAAEEAHRGGVRRFFGLAHRRELKLLAGRLPEFAAIALKYWLVGPSAELRADLLTLTVDRALFAGGGVPRTAEAYGAAAAEAVGRLQATGEAVAGLVNEILQQNLQLALALEEQGRVFVQAATDVRDQLVFLLPRHFLLTTPWQWLEQVPRYLAGMRIRLEKLAQGGAGIVDRDREAAGKALAWHQQYLARREQQRELGVVDAELGVFYWMLQEYRVALFAQELGTAVQISERRLEKQWEKTRR